MDVCPLAQGRLSQNVPQWHYDYFGLKLIKKQPMKRDIGPSPLSPQKQEISLSVKGALLASGVGRRPLPPETDNLGWRSLYTHLVTFKIYFPKPKLC